MNESTDRTRDYERYAVVAVLVLLIIGCYLVVRPFVTAFLWGGILSTSTRGLYERLRRLLGGKRRLAAALTSLTLAAVLFVPITAFAIRLAGETPMVVERDQRDAARADCESRRAGSPRCLWWRKPANAWWQSVATDPEKLRGELRPLVGPVKDFLVAAAAGLGAGILEFALAV